MSLYGSGRSEGIVAVLLVGALVVGVRALGAWLGDEGELLAALAPAWLPALGGMLTYRFLRSQGRSRFAAFLVGTAYGVSPWLLAMYASPREQLAAALAPLALEAACRCDRPIHRDAWLPWAWLCFAAPFVAGITVVGMLSAMLCGVILARTLLCGDREQQRLRNRGLVILVPLAALAAANLAWLDLATKWFGPGDITAPEFVLAAHRPEHPGFDVAAVLRVPGAVLLSLALLGLLRRQRHVDRGIWCAIAIAGGLPTLFAAVPWLREAAPAWANHPMLPAGAWWLTLLAVAVLAAAGLDDFFDLPLRRRTALPWLLAIAVASAPWLPVTGARIPEREWPLTATFIALPLVLPAWRQLGIVRFKNWFAVLTLVALAIPMLQVRTVAPQLGAPPAPLADVAGQPQSFVELLRQVPAWHYAGLVVALCGGCWLAASAWRRNRHASMKPIAANAAIIRKARPAHRS